VCGIGPCTIGCNLCKLAVVPNLIRNARTVTHSAALGPSRAVVYRRKHERVLNSARKYRFYFPTTRIVNDPGTIGLGFPWPPCGGRGGAGGNSAPIRIRWFVLLSNARVFALGMV